MPRKMKPRVLHSNFTLLQTKSYFKIIPPYIAVQVYDQLVKLFMHLSRKSYYLIRRSHRSIPLSLFSSYVHNIASFVLSVEILKLYVNAECLADFLDVYFNLFAFRGPAKKRPFVLPRCFPVEFYEFISFRYLDVLLL